MILEMHKWGKIMSIILVLIKTKNKLTTTHTLNQLRKLAMITSSQRTHWVNIFYDSIPAHKNTLCKKTNTSFV